MPQIAIYRPSFAFACAFCLAAMSSRIGMTLPLSAQSREYSAEFRSRQTTDRLIPSSSAMALSVARSKRCRRTMCCWRSGSRPIVRSIIQSVEVSPSFSFGS